MWWWSNKLMWIIDSLVMGEIKGAAPIMRQWIFGGWENCGFKLIILRFLSLGEDPRQLLLIHPRVQNKVISPKSRLTSHMTPEAQTFWRYNELLDCLMHINHANSSKPSSSAEQKRTFQCCHVHNFAESGGRECEMSSQQQRTYVFCLSKFNARFLLRRLSRACSAILSIAWKNCELFAEPQSPPLCSEEWKFPRKFSSALAGFFCATNTCTSSGCLCVLLSEMK